MSNKDQDALYRVVVDLHGESINIHRLCEVTGVKLYPAIKAITALEDEGKIVSDEHGNVKENRSA